MKSRKMFNVCILGFFFTLFLMAGGAAYGAEQGLGGSSGSQPGILPLSGDKELPASASDAQILMRGGKEVEYFEEVLIDTGHPGLGGETGSQPGILPVPAEDEKWTEAAEAQDWKDGYEVIPYTEDASGNTGKPGLGGETGSQPQTILPEDKGATAASSNLKK